VIKGSHGNTRTVEGSDDVRRESGSPPSRRPRMGVDADDGTDGGRLADRAMLLDSIRDARNSNDQRFVSARALLRDDNNR
jgi:hypothetical protein